MKFSAQFEFHKIPEWYSEYLDYKRFKAMIRAFKLQVKGNATFVTLSRWPPAQAAGSV